MTHERKESRRIRTVGVAFRFWKFEVGLKA